MNDSVIFKKYTEFLRKTDKYMWPVRFRNTETEVYFNITLTFIVITQSLIDTYKKENNYLFHKAS